MERIDPFENLRQALARAKIIMGRTPLVTKEQTDRMLADVLARKNQCSR